MVSNKKKMLRLRIIKIANKKLAEGGYNNLSMREIGRNLDVPLINIQRIFKTKDDLWQACIDDYFNQIKKHLVGFDHLTIDQIIVNQLNFQIHQKKTIPGITATIWNDHSPGYQHRLNYLIKQIKPLIDQIETNINWAITQQKIEPINAKLLIAFMSVGMASFFSTPKQLKNVFGLDLNDQLVSDLSQIILKGIQPSC